MYIDIIFKTFILYFIIVIAYRVMGKKEVGELSIIDLIVTILIAELAAMCIEESKRSIFISIIPIVELVIIQISLSYISLKNNSIRNFIDGKPSVIIKKGKVCFEQMTKLRYSLDDLISQLREKGIKSIEEVDYAVLENSGTLSVFEKTKDYPMPIILDGVIDYEVLKEIKKDNIWLHKLLSSKNLKLEDIFYAFYTKDKTFIIKKSDLI
jgi:uncharacterized membrane protein YcaP (DUF421 family)